MGYVGPTNRRRDLGRRKKCQLKPPPLEPPPPVPIPVGISAVIGIFYFSDQSGNGGYPLSCLPLIFLKSTRKEDVKKRWQWSGNGKSASPAPTKSHLVLPTPVRRISDFPS